VVVVVVELDVIGAGAGAGCCTTTAGGGSLETIGAGEVFSVVLWYEHADTNPHTAIAAETIASRLERIKFEPPDLPNLVAATSSRVGNMFSKNPATSISLDLVGMPSSRSTVPL
jgi:hypothetical protein